MMLWAASLVAALPIPLMYVLTPLRENEPGGHDIASFEFAGSVARANEILATWRAAGVERMAKYLQLFDVVYPIVYAVALAGCAIAAGHALRRRRGAQVLLHSRDDRVRVGRSRGVDETGIRRRLSRCLCFPEGVGIGERNQQV
jgi:hypothetical protein